VTSRTGIGKKVISIKIKYIDLLSIFTNSELRINKTWHYFCNVK